MARHFGPKNTGITPPFPPDSCYLPGAPCQTTTLIQDNFQSSQNTGGNCHFTGNTGITGVRATPELVLLLSIELTSAVESII